jgi:hypothetical protein
MPDAPKPRRTLEEINKTHAEVKARLAREGKTHIAWYDDKELFEVIMELFNHYRHHWSPIRPRSKILKSLCTSFEHRGGMPNEEGRPMCPGCARKLKGDWS